MVALIHISVIFSLGLIQFHVLAVPAKLPKKSKEPVPVQAPDCGGNDMYAICRLQPNSHNIQGTVYMKQFHSDCMTEQLIIQVNITNAPNKGKQNKKHGMHVHEFGDISSGCAAAGGHFNPFKSPHGGPGDLKGKRHVGDFGNVHQYKSKPGVIEEGLMDYIATIAGTGQTSIIGKSIVLHLKKDDLGKGKNPESKKTGNAGQRLACCTIERSTEPIPDSVFTIQGLL